MKNILILSFVIFATCIFSVSGSTLYQQNFSAPNVGSGVGAPQFVVQTLKYEPFPVNAGDWFDLWVKVQNIGGAAAPNARFEIIPEYPFSSNDSSLVQTYGLIGSSTDNGQIVLKFRVKVADNAAAGESKLKLAISVNGNDSSSPQLISYLPISIDKTKTDFDVLTNGEAPQGLSLTIANIGDNDAGGITVRTLDSSDVSYTGQRVFSLGTLRKGDSTTINVPVSLASDKGVLNLAIDYNDKGNARTTLTKEVSLSGIGATNLNNSAGSNSYIKWIYAFVGILVGMILLALLRKLYHPRFR